MKLRYILASVVLALAACATPAPSGSPAQDAVNLTGMSCKNIAAAIVAADQAILSGALKGKNADAAVKGLSAAQAGCVAALASVESAAAAASGASK